MKFSPHSKGRLLAAGQDIDQIRLILSRIETCFPHLNFSPWNAVLLTLESKSPKKVFWKPSGIVEISIVIDELLNMSATCYRTRSGVSRDDYDLLSGLAEEAAATLGSRLDMPVPLIEFGSYAVAGRIEGMIGSDRGKVYPTLMFVRSLMQETYENQRLSYGLILSNRKDGTHYLSEAFDNKRLKRLTDGFSTAIVLDAWQRIADFVPLNIPAEETLKLARRPWWCAGLAEESQRASGVGIALVRSGDLVIVNKGKLVLSQRSGRWQVWDHTAILSLLRGSWKSPGPRKNLSQVLGCLYHVALDLSFKRSGGLLVVVNAKKDLRSLLMSRGDNLESTRRGPGEQAIDEILKARTVRQIDRRILADIASLDGALIVDRNGSVLAYGAMTRPGASTHQGARTNAALAASRKGLVIKISSDGNISFFAHGKNFMNL